MYCTLLKDCVLPAGGSQPRAALSNTAIHSEALVSSVAACRSSTSLSLTPHCWPRTSSSYTRPRRQPCSSRSLRPAHPALTEALVGSLRVAWHSQKGCAWRHSAKGKTQGAQNYSSGPCQQKPQAACTPAGPLLIANNVSTNPASV